MQVITYILKLCFTIGLKKNAIIFTYRQEQQYNLLQNIISETLHDHHTSTSIGGRPIRNLRFAECTDPLVGTNRELQDLTNILTDSSKAYGIETSTEKSKVVINGSGKEEIHMNRVQLEEVSSYK